MKKTIKLTESEFNDFILENVKNILTEMDWRTYKEASKKDKNPKRSKSFNDYGTKVFNDKFGFEDEIDDFGRAHNHVKMTDDNKLNSYSENDSNTISTLSSISDKLKNITDRYKDSYTVHHNDDKPVSRNYKNARKQAKAYDAYNDYYSGNSKYEKGKGWNNPEMKTNFHDLMKYDNK